MMIGIIQVLLDGYILSYLTVHFKGFIPVLGQSKISLSCFWT